MHYTVNILTFSATLAFIAVFASMAVAGIWRGYIYYEPSRPPIVFRRRPVAFTTLCSFYLAVVGALSVGAVHLGSALLGMP